MIAPSNTQVIALIAVLIAGAGGTAAVVLQQRRAADVAPPPVAQEAMPSPLAAVQSQAAAVANALGGTDARQQVDDGVPTFDVARIEPSGEAVIAGRATPGAAVELMRDDEVLDRAVANADGQFVMVPSKPLPGGSYGLTLRAKKAGSEAATRSKQSVAVALTPNTSERPAVALMTPDRPTVVLSQPGAARQPPGTIVVEAVEMQAGKLHVSGRARAGATARFYLNDSFVAAATAGADGRFAITINEGVAPGSYRVRLDEVEGASGAVRARAEVPFTVPAVAVAAAAPPPTRTNAELAAVTPPATTPPTTVVVPKIATVTVSAGDSLWSISQLTYGAGNHYAVVGSSRVDLQACKLEYSIVSPK